MAIALVDQDDTQTAGTSGTATVAVSAGDLAVLTWVIRNGATLSSVSGSVNGAYTQAITRADGGARAGIHFFMASGAGTETVTLTAGASDTLLLNLTAWSGAHQTSVLDQTNSVLNSATTTHGHGSITTASDCGLIITCAGQASTITDETVASGFTALDLTAGNNRQWWQYRTSGAASLTTDGAYTASSHTSSAVIASFLNAAGGGSTVVVPGTPQRNRRHTGRYL